MLWSEQRRTQGPRVRSRRCGRFEVLECRALLASTVFSAPDITTFAREAKAGQNTAPATISAFVNALQTQLTNGPVADLQAGTVDASGFQTEVTDLLTSFASATDTALLPSYPNVDAIIKLSGTKIGAELTSIGQQQTVGLIDTTTAESLGQTAIAGLTSGPLKPLGTTPAALKARSSTFESDLNVLAQSLATSATTSLTIDQVNTTAAAEADAYEADINASLYGRKAVTTALANSISTFESTVASIADGTSTATGTDQAQFQAASSALISSLPTLLRPRSS